MFDATELKAHYSNRRPKNQAWRVESGEVITYAETEQEALELHRSKCEMRGSIDELLCRCAAVN